MRVNNVLRPYLSRGNLVSNKRGKFKKKKKKNVLVVCKIQRVEIMKNYKEYSEIPLLRPLKNKTFCQLKTLFAKFKLFISSFSTPSVSLIRDHHWNSPEGGLNIGILLYIDYEWITCVVT